MKYLMKFNEAFDVTKKYPKKPGESTSAYRTRILRLKRQEQEGWKTVEKPEEKPQNKPISKEEEKSLIIDIIPEIQIGDPKFDKEVELVGKTYAENKIRLDEIMDKFMAELRLSKNDIYNSDGTPKDADTILQLFNEKGLLVEDERKRERLSNLSKELNDIISKTKNEEVYTPVIALSLGIIGTITVLAWMRGRTRLGVYQTAGPKPTKWYQKAYHWLKSKGIDLSFGLDPNRETPLIVSDRPYGRTYGENSSDPNDKVRTVLSPEYGPEKGGQPLVTGSGTRYGYRTSVG